jgi:hypothetical protein
MPGSWVAEPVAVCDIAGPLRPHSNAVDKMAKAEGVKKLDEDLMTVSSQIQADMPSWCAYGTTQRVAAVTDST